MKHRILIPSESAGERLDVALAKAGGRTRAQAQKLLKEHRVTLRGQIATPRMTVSGGEELELTLGKEPPQPPPPGLKVLFEDNDMLAVDKPAGLAVHVGETGRPQPTVAAFAAARVDDDDRERPGIVHRLDKETSGVLLIAKHPRAKQWLQKQFHDRLVDKHYEALVRGRLRQPEASIKLPVGRSRKYPTKRAVLPGGRMAVTHYRLRRQYPGASLVDVKPETGRTHQIRVHFAHLGHPVIGDSLYGAAEPALRRFFLHAASVSLISPAGRRVTIRSPLPAELKAYLAALEGYN